MKYLIHIVLLGFSSSTYLTVYQNLNKNSLLKRWDLYTYEMDQKQYKTAKAEKDDYIHFKSNMTFVSKFEGKAESGHWMYNTNGSYIELIDGDGEKLKAFVISITAEHLVLQFDLDELRNINAIYRSH